MAKHFCPGHAEREASGALTAFHRVQAGAENLRHERAFVERERQHGANKGAETDAERGQHVVDEDDLEQHGGAAKQPQIKEHERLDDTARHAVEQRQQ